MEKQARQTSYEALRILAMFMVISMHYLQKGGVLKPLSDNMNVVNLVAWLVETLCIGAANAYVLISGYFLVEASWKWQKLLSLVAQIWVYSWSVPVACLIFGIGNVAAWGIYDWITVILPLQSEHYWFATAYVLLYLIVPVLQAGVKRLEKKQMELLLVFLLVFFCLIKSFSPVSLPTDRYGYDFGWFICLFLIAAYLRLYGLPVLEKGRRSLLLYFGMAAAIWVIGLGFSLLTKRGLSLSYAKDMLYSYNHMLVLLLSIGLFGIFRKIEIKKDGPGRLITLLAPGTFGVYLLHENIAIRHLWQGWLGIERVRDSLFFLPHMAVAVVIVFMAGSVADLVRRKIWKIIWSKPI